MSELQIIDELGRTKNWFEKAVPKPAVKNLHGQLAAHFEEVHEMVVEITPMDEKTANILQDLNIALVALVDHLKISAKTEEAAIQIEPEKRIKYLDAICDQIVTATGCAHMSGLNVVGAMSEVNRSNFSKFDEKGDPIFNENHKIIKGPNYSPADLSLYI